MTCNLQNTKKYREMKWVINSSVFIFFFHYKQSGSNPPHNIPPMQGQKMGSGNKLVQIFRAIESFIFKIYQVR